MSNDTFVVYGIGDSVMWGQGLKTKDKFINLIGKRLSKEWGYEKYATYNFARSGAVLDYDLENAHTGMETYLSEHEYARELPSAFPTILQQIEFANEGTEHAKVYGSHTSFKPKNEDVNLILLSGGINDIDVSHILSGGLTHVQELTDDHCFPTLTSKVFPELHLKFPNALICMVSYFPILGGQSNHDKSIRVLRYLQDPNKYEPIELDFAQYIDENIEDSPLFPPGFGEPVSELVESTAEVFLDGYSGVKKMFEADSPREFINATFDTLKDFGSNLVDLITLSGSDDMDTDVYTEAYLKAVYSSAYFFRQYSHMCAKVASTMNRIYGVNSIFVDANYSFSNVALGSEPCLFPLGKGTRNNSGVLAALNDVAGLFPESTADLDDMSPQDDVIAERGRALRQYRHLYDSKTRFAQAFRASVGHPNKAGAEKYADAVVSDLTRLRKPSMKALISDSKKSLKNYSKSMSLEAASLRSMVYQTQIQHAKFVFHFPHAAQARLLLGQRLRLKTGPHSAAFYVDSIVGNEAHAFLAAPRHMPKTISQLESFTLQILGDVRGRVPSLDLVINGVPVKRYSNVSLGGTMKLNYRH